MDAISLVLEGHPKDIGGLTVRRVLPSMKRRLVGPFIFFDHMGPVEFAPGQGIEVRPHPHIGLATITYLFEGEIVHRDTLGSAQAIVPGDVNWMIAGRGIAHSERTRPEVRARGSKMHGLQTWVALPKSHEEMEPRFEHHEHEERAAYVASGAIEVDDRTFGEGTMVVFTPRAHVTIQAKNRANVMLVGGAPIDGKRLIWWNFVASSQEKIDRASAAWREGRFPKVPGDDVEFIPLPEPR